MKFRENNWFYMNDIDEMPDVSSIQCDTRDFFICPSMKTPDIEIPENVEEYMFARWEILGMLNTLECLTGGKGPWRALYNKYYPGWHKYIRFVKHQDGYILCDRHFVPMKRSLWNCDENISTEPFSLKNSRHH